jgi:hypothetical protein
VQSGGGELPPQDGMPRKIFMTCERRYLNLSALCQDQKVEKQRYAYV